MHQLESTPAISMVPVVSSSNVTAFGYDPTSNTLAVSFKGGSMYDYPNVPPEVHQAFADAESKGSYFLKQIRPNYVGVKRAPAEPEPTHPAA